MTVSATRTARSVSGEIAREVLDGELRRKVLSVRDMVVLWVVYLAVVALIGFVLWFWATPGSMWESALSVVKVFGLVLGIYLTAVYLPLYVCHGYTRWRFLARAAGFCLVFSVVVGALLAAGYLVELVAFRALGWRVELSEQHLFTASTQVHLLLAEYVPLVATYIVVGAMLGAAFYRTVVLGLALIPVALVLLVGPQAVLGVGQFGPLPLPGIDLAPSGTLTALLLTTAAASVLIAAVVTAAIARDIPIRTKSG
ncbi:hypothetical protein [Haloechinothrix sp. LS1_15]|uniref:hypothetical protein n=1 Tax=Haloechinothrix sp. LS1_15 TaxID=2652248 RepID=UPI002944536A|nr:hypothetical protein [Haloechinothrix sp. LS1_15]MDV6011604.1 hypothetical protein [Haloechinothrix sp. LS1_15]